MSPSKSFIQYFAVVLLLSLCSVQQVYSRICYVCDSDVDPECISYPHQDKFARICTPSYTRDSDNSELLNSNIRDKSAARAIQNDCATAVGISTVDGRTRIVRGCSVLPVTCDTYQIIYAVKFNFQVNKCLRCNSDSCNFRNY